MGKNFDFGERKLSRGVYEVRVTKVMQVTVNSPYSINESDLVMKAILLGSLDSFDIVELGDKDGAQKG